MSRTGRRRRSFVHARAAFAVVAAAAVTFASTAWSADPSGDAARRPPPVTQQTALVSVVLASNGRITVDHHAVKPIPWRTPSAGFHKARHAVPMASFPTAKASQVAVVVRHPSLHAPHVVTLSLKRVARGGDVVDPWDSGAQLWRLPWFGPGTTLTIVRTAPDKPAALSFWRAAP